MTAHMTAHMTGIGTATGTTRRGVVARATPALVCAAVLTAAVTSCSTTQTSSDAKTGSSAEVGAGVGAEASQAATAEELAEYHAGADTSPGTSGSSGAALRWDAGEQRRVTSLARSVMGLFARPDVPAERWWADIRSYLSPQAQSDYLGVDPADVPVREVTGQVELVGATQTPADPSGGSDARPSSDLGGPPPAVVIAHVPTDAGLYAVTLSRSAERPAWLVERITPPEPDPH